MLTSTGFHAAATVVLAAGTGVPKLCEPLSADLAIAASPATLARVTAPPGLVKTIVAALISRSEKFGKATSCWSCRMSKA